MEKIDRAELERMLMDPDVPDSAIRPYLQLDPLESRALQPVVVPNPARVHYPETEAAVAEVIDQREILVGGKRMMAVQEPPLPEEKLAINLRGLRVEKPEHEGVPVEMLAQDAGWFEPRRHIFGKARAVTLYPLPPETDLWKRQVAARVHALAAASRGKAP